MNRIKQAFYSAKTQAALRRVLGVYWSFELPATSGNGFDATVPMGSQPTPVEAPFEVNMMECLVGWKGWVLDGRGLLSPAYTAYWPPDKAFEALCGICREVVSEKHTCGVYAADEAAQARDHGYILGQVWGWGRYVRGNRGWRAQWAYPKSFHLTSGQAEYIEPLRKYHCPIFIDEPLRVYDPAEEGYILEAEDGYRNAEEDRDRRAAEAAPPGEAGDCDAQANEAGS